MIHLSSEITQEEKLASVLETLYEYNSPKKIGTVQEGFLVPLIANWFGCFVKWNPIALKVLRNVSG